ncbi:WD40-repeat-containing domain protein [Zopfochytrium polystomum]|nr:WD40-repeat-containing domain protein [Zopfochytrium polystomum]
MGNANKDNPPRTLPSGQRRASRPPTRQPQHPPRPRRQPQHNAMQPSLESMPEEVLFRVLKFLQLSSDFKSLARLCRVSRRWSLRAADDRIWRPIFLARWAPPVSLADSPNILDRGQTTRKVRADRRRVPIASVPWKTLFRDRTALAGFRSRVRTRTGDSLKGTHAHFVHAICVDAYSIVTASQDGKVKIWERSTRKCVRTLDASELGVTSVACHGSTIVCGTTDGLVKVWDAKTGVHQDTLRGLRFAPHQVNVWSRSTKNIVQTFAKRWLSKVDVHESFLAYADLGNTVQVVRLPSGDVVHSGQFKTAVGSIQLAKSMLAVELENGVCVWDIQSGKRSFVEICSDWGLVLCLYDGNLLVKSRKSGMVSMEIRDLKEGGKLLQVFPPRRGAFHAGIALHASGIAAGDAYGQVVMWDFDKGISYAHEFMELKK